MLTSVIEKLIFHTSEKKMSFQELVNVEVRNRDDLYYNFIKGMFLVLRMPWSQFLK